MDLRQIKVTPDEFGMMTYDPALMNTASCKSRITFIDGDEGILLYRGYPIEQLAEHSDFLETSYLILFGELPTPPQLEGWTPRRHDAHDAPREHQEVSRGVSLRRAPHGHVPERGRRPVDVLSGREEHLRRRVAAAADDPAHRQGAGHRRLRVSSQHRPAVRAAGQRAGLLGQLPEHAVQDDRAALQATSGARAGSGRAVHPARRSRAELQHQRNAQHRQLARRSVFGTGRRGGSTLRSAPRRRQRGGAAHAERDRVVAEHPGLRQASQSGRRAADGIRPPRLQVVRPAREDHQAHGGSGLRGHRARTRCSRWRSSSSGLPSKTTTS